MQTFSYTHTDATGTASYDPRSASTVVYYEAGTTGSPDISEFAEKIYDEGLFPISDHYDERELDNQRYGKRWFEHCRKRMGKNRLQQSFYGG
jgi:hypothetical protein